VGKRWRKEKSQMRYKREKNDTPTPIPYLGTLLDHNRKRIPTNKDVVIKKKHKETKNPRHDVKITSASPNFQPEV
jgi:hypothetical protein